ncbi:uncharacterized protein LOC122670945 isoform X1 [Telopea speciosissima]|uniref:uncharacterized protein LOC122670945 isoform X1 n=1 Tax=Telopea speciosissima TaxID=54955 RepID=UPI001CC7278F|nr:uncharacterized protein LOC122670945 isoform X1 [Telopea speciosissima]
MFSFCSRKLLHVKWSDSSSTTCLLPIIGNSSLRFSSNATEQSSLTVDYLINKCGLTQESALKASQRINIKSTSKADSVLALLISYGLPKPYISKLISKDPTVLSADPKKILVPKIEFFSNMGISGPNLAKIFYRDTSILGSANLRNQIISMEFLKSFLHDDKNIAVALSRLRWTTGIQSAMEPNIEILRNQGVPESGISKLIRLRPQLLTWKQPQFNEVVLQAKEMGCDPSSLMFIHAIRTLSQMNKATLEAKREVFRSFGWSEDEILCMFRKQPNCLTRSEKILRMRLDFFMNEHSWTAAEVALRPAVLLYSMEKRTVPRYSVIQFLLSQGLMKKQSISTAFSLNEDKFLENFVRKYHQELPQLLKEYKRNME